MPMTFPRPRRAARGATRVFLHAGHGKTGSSMIQSSLALSQAALAGHGLAYPLDPASAALAEAGRISAGNLEPGPGNSVHPPDRVARLLERHPLPEGQALVLSNENIFRSIAEAGFLEALQAALPGAEVRVLLFIRDPLDHAISAYQQNVKRRGRVDSFTEFLPSYGIGQAVGRCIDLVQQAGGSIEVRNYSRHKDDLLAVVEPWLGLPPGTLVQPPVARVNRSLNRAELELQRAFNRHFGRGSARFVSDMLCNGLPDIPSEAPHAEPAAVRAFLERMRAQVAPLNARLPEAERYRVETEAEALARLPSAEEARRLVFTPRQLQLLARSLTREIRAGRRGGG